VDLKYPPPTDWISIDPMKKRGFFITFEGIEGSGKTTQLKRMAAFLKRQGYPVLTTREPGGTATGEKIRKLLLSNRTRRLHFRSELFLYLASRAQHVEEILLPALRRGKIVLCDRYSDATLVYQGYGRALPRNRVREAIRFAARNLVPDLTILLDIGPEQGLQRIRRRGRANRIDREKLVFHRRIRRGYLQLARSSPKRIRVIDADRNMDLVAGDVSQTVVRSIRKRKNPGIR
jgi:dTMP kinase